GSCHPHAEQTRRPAAAPCPAPHPARPVGQQAPPACSPARECCCTGQPKPRPPTRTQSFTLPFRFLNLRKQIQLSAGLIDLPLDLLQMIRTHVPGLPQALL